MDFFGYIFLTLSIASGIYLGFHPEVFKRIVGLFLKLGKWIFLVFGWGSLAWWLISTVEYRFYGPEWYKINFTSQVLGLLLFLSLVYRSVKNIKQKGFEKYLHQDVIPEIKKIPIITFNILSGVIIVLIIPLTFIFDYAAIIGQNHIPWFTFVSVLMTAVSIYILVRSKNVFLKLLTKKTSLT
jgi:hypothetical protein